MARTPTNGKAVSVSTDDFNARVKRLLEGKPEPQKAEERRRSAPRPRKPQE